jgi:hypothetical protein
VEKLQFGLNWNQLELNKNSVELKLNSMYLNSIKELELEFNSIKQFEFNSSGFIQSHSICSFKWHLIST